MTVPPAITGTEKYRDYYGEDARRDEWRRVCASAKCANIVRLCGDIPHERILEIGCGSGEILAELCRRKIGSELTGIEISESGLDRLREKSIPCLADARLFDGARVPFQDQTFDLAVLSHVVEHLEHPRMMLYEAGRVAKHVFVEVPLEHTARMKSDFDFNEVGHINFYTAKTIRRLLQTSGMVVERQLIADTSREMLEFMLGRRGIIQHAVRNLALHIAPGLAQRIFVYHCALLARPISSI